MNKEKLFKRNKKIIDVIINQIENNCPGTIDLIGISGSFCSCNFYEKSDLDLVIVSNDIAKSNILSKCFILDGIGYDIYLSDWNRFEKMSKYNDQYVTKLKDLDIVYLRNNECLDRYKKYQEKLTVNMNDKESIKNKVNNYYENILLEYQRLNTNKQFYRILGSIMSNIETIIYMMNKEYIHGSTKNIPEEISNMKNIPSNFIERYLKLISDNNKENIINMLNIIIDDLKYYYVIDIKNVNNFPKDKKINNKKKIASDDLTGTYEELFSNYYNKLYHAVDINSQFLSFRTMSDAQGFFDEFYEQFEIPNYNLIEKYNPNDLKANADKFSLLLGEWKKLYDSFDKKIEIYDNIEKIY